MDRKKWSKLLFVGYCALMLWLLYGQRIGQAGSGTYWQQLKSHIVYTPFETIRRFLWVLRYSDQPGMIRHAVVNLAGNVIMFVPLGCLAPCIWKKLQKFGRHFLTMVLIIVIIELTQLFTLLGSCDVDDLMLNLVGTTIGFVLWIIWHWMTKE